MDIFLQEVQQLADLLKKSRCSLAVAESCTGGGIAFALTELAGASDWFDRGFVVYSNLAKTEQLGVSSELITAYGAVSELVAIAMAQGALKNSEAQFAIATTGIAGPTGGSEEKPVGTVYIALANFTQAQAKRYLVQGDRAQIRRRTIQYALQGAIEFLSKHK